MASYRQRPESIIAISRWLLRAVDKLNFGPPVTHVYNPLDYAWAAHAEYLRRFAGEARREIVLVGMNPGPWGMAQTGVPFGEVRAVREWMGIEADIRRPKREHRRRPVNGFACERVEVSGYRLWGWARQRFGTAERFFARFFVANYCPLMFLEASGRNRTPDRLPKAERQPLLEICDQGLRRTIETLGPRLVVGVGRFAERRARDALSGLGLGIGGILHPSPANPAANRDWQTQIEGELRALGVCL